MKLKINDTIYTVTVAKTEEEKKVGLSNVNYLPDNEGMLFIFNNSQDVSFTMRDTKIPLDIIFIDDEQEVISVKKGEPLSDIPITESDVKYVLELNIDSDVEEDDKIFFSDDEEEPLDDDKKSPMLVLDSLGNVQMELESGERIFSRIHTKSLIKSALKANTTKSDDDYIRLGKKILKYINVQDNNKPEYITN